MARKRSGSKAKSGSAGKDRKAKPKQGLKDLQVRDSKGVRGGGKYMEVTMENVTITH